MDDLKTALGKHSHLSPPEMLAITAQLVGNLIALQDQTKHTSEACMRLVEKNIEIGNAACIETLLGKTEGKA